MVNQFGSIEDLFGGASGSDVSSGSDAPKKPAAPRSAPTSPTKRASSQLQEKMRSVDLANKEDEAQELARRTGLPYIDLNGFPISPEAISLIPEEVSREVGALSFFRLDRQVRLAVVNPDHARLHDVIAAMKDEHPSIEVSLYVTSQHSYEVGAEAYKGVIKTKEIEYGVNITPEDLQRYQQELTSDEVFQEKLRHASMTSAFAMMISMALNRGSSDVHVEAQEKRAVIRFRIDGILTEVAIMDIRHLQRLVNRIKAIAGLKINITDTPQDGRITINMGPEDKLDLRVSTLPSAFGESIVFRLLKSSSVGLSFEDLGMRPLAFERLKKEIEKPNGMVITTGPTGSGKTTTLYAILNRLNTPENKVITLENPIEYKLQGIVQSQIDHSRKYTFSKGLRSILRQDPDIVMVGEIRDLETAKTAVEASLTGHLMLSTIHTNDAAGVVPRFLGMGVEGIFLAPALNAVIGQRLVRRICSDCKTEYTPAAEDMTRAQELVAGIPESSGEQRPDLNGVTFYKGAGCAACGDSGYKGRIGIYEIFTMSAEIEQQILSGSVSEYEMKKILHDAGMITMAQDGVLKVVDGITTLEEIFRVAKD